MRNKTKQYHKHLPPTFFFSGLISLLKVFYMVLFKQCKEKGGLVQFITIHLPLGSFDPKILRKSRI